MEINRLFKVGNLAIVFDLIVNEDPTKYIFLFKKGDNRIYVFGASRSTNHTILLRHLYDKYGLSVLNTDIVAGGWVRLIDHQIRFSGASRKYGNKVLCERVSNIIQSLLLNSSETRSKRILPKSERKINQLKCRYKILERA